MNKKAQILSKSCQNIIALLEQASVMKSNVTHHLQFVLLALSTAAEMLRKSSQANRNV